MAWIIQEEVYCEDCKNYRGCGSCSYGRTTSTPVRRKTKVYERCSSMNSDNNCPVFEKRTKKWWEFWK